MGNDAVIDLVRLTRPVETAQKIDSLMRGIIKKPSSGIKKDDKNKGISPEDAYNEMDKILTSLLESANACISSLSYSSTINDAQRLLNDVMGKVMSIQKLLIKVTGRSFLASDLATSTSSTLSLWSPSGSGAAILEPIKGSRLQGEVTPKLSRMQMYITAIEQHMKAMNGTHFIDNIKKTKQNTEVIIGDLLKTLSDPECNRLEIRTSVTSTLKMYMKNIRVLFKQYEDKQADFVISSNRKGLDYMLKWLAVKERNIMKNNKPVVGSEESDLLEKYFEEFGKAASTLNDTLMEAETETLQIFGAGPYMPLIGEDAGVVERLQTDVDNLERFILNIRKRLTRLYSPSGYNVLDIIFNTSFILIYIIKALRVFFLWSAMVFAKSFFQARYNDAVYMQNKNPPHPLWFVLIFLAFDLSLNIGLYIVMRTLMFLFKTRDNSFPINDYLMKALIVDYILSTVLIGILAILLSIIVQRKKYFRYRFEGDRGIRALSDMILWTSAAILVIPYFRFFDA